MFKKYLATKEDLQAIDEGLRYVWHSKMNFVFEDRNKIKDVPVISYDAENFYLWSNQKFSDLEKIPNNFKKYTLYKITHNLKKIPEKWQRGWFSGIKIEKIKEVLFKKTKKYLDGPNGGLLTPFIKSHPHDPYHTYESYLATIIHEFGHIYWASFKLWWLSENSTNLRSLKIAEKLYSNLKPNLEKYSPTFPVLPAFGEVFAFCAEYYASSLFWPTYKRNLDEFTKERIEKLEEEEKSKDLTKEDSVLEPTRNSHDFAFIFGKIIITQKPRSWPKLLTQPYQLKF